MTEEQITKAKEIAGRTDILTLIGQSTTLQGGNELFGPCPICKAGEDRFHVKPNDNIWFCRYCTGSPEDNGWYDQIEFVRRYYNMDFIEALKYLAPSVFGETESKPVSPKSPPPSPRKPDELPDSDWQTKAIDAAVNLADDLWQNPKARQWLNRRGIDDQAIIRYNLGYTGGGKVNGLWFGLKPSPNEPSKPERGIVIPHWSQRYKTLFGLKVRRPVGKPKYYCASGSKVSTNLFNSDSLTGKDICFVTEGEFDAISLHSHIGDLAAVVTLGSEGAKLPDRWLTDIYHIKRFIIVTDCGEDEAAANYWLSLVGKRGRRFILPGQAKDICEAAEGGLDLRDWAIAVIQSIGA